MNYRKMMQLRLTALLDAIGAAQSAKSFSLDGAVKIRRATAAVDPVLEIGETADELLVDLGKARDELVSYQLATSLLANTAGIPMEDKTGAEVIQEATTRFKNQRESIRELSGHIARRQSRIFELAAKADRLKKQLRTATQEDYEVIVRIRSERDELRRELADLKASTRNTTSTAVKLAKYEELAWEAREVLSAAAPGGPHTIRGLLDRERLRREGARVVKETMQEMDEKIRELEAQNQALLDRAEIAEARLQGSRNRVQRKENEIGELRFRTEELEAEVKELNQRNDTQAETIRIYQAQEWRLGREAGWVRAA